MKSTIISTAIVSAAAVSANPHIAHFARPYSTDNAWVPGGPNDCTFSCPSLIHLSLFLFAEELVSSSLFLYQLRPFAK